ncbi:MAG: hypothetical protein CMN30_31700 [Sandaracinus sp.]|nr:hypothetical protein [Sandaracinus sp.]
MRWLSPWVAMVLLLGACGDDDGDGAPPDSGIDAGVDAGPRDLGQPPAPIAKRPWVLGTTTTSAVVRWEVPEEPESVTLTWTPEAGGEATTVEGTTEAYESTLDHGLGFPTIDFPDLPGTYHLQEVRITGLDPATCYTYEVPALAEGGRFCTMHEATDHETPIELLVIGDTSPVLGRTGGLLEQLAEPEVEMTLHAGDLQYYDALIETWAVWFGAHEPILAQGAFWPTIGNHEQEREGEYEQTYARYFADPATDAEGNPDGNTAAYHFQSGGVHFFSVNSEDDIGEFDADFSWLEEGLTAAEASEGFRFSIVFFHRPIYTLAEHAPSESLRAILEPILQRHEVALVLQGHNHVYERFDVDGLPYVVTGGGGSGIYGLDDQVEVRPDEVPLRVAAGAFIHGVRVTITATEMHLRAIDAEGAIRDEVRFALD